MSFIPSPFILPDSPVDSVSSLQFHPSPPSNLQYLLSGSWSKEMIVHELTLNGPSGAAAPSSQCLKARVPHPAPILAVTWGLDDKSALTAAADGIIRLFDISSPASFASPVVVGRHSGPVRSLLCSRTMNALVSASWDPKNTLAIWDARFSASSNSQTPAESTNLADRIYAFDLKDTNLIVAASNRNFYHFDLRKFSQPVRAPWASPLKYQTKSIALMTRDPGFAAGSIEGRCCIQYFNESDASKNFSFKCHRDPASHTAYAVNDVAFHPVHGSFATVGGDGTWHIWDHLSKSRLRQFNKEPNSITKCAFDPTGTLFAYALGYDWSGGPQEAEKRKSPNHIAIQPLPITEGVRRGGT